MLRGLKDLFRGKRGAPVIEAWRAVGEQDPRDNSWPALEPGECPGCGHEWITGEIIGPIFMTYCKHGDGSVTFNPRVWRACCVCVEKARVYGDPSWEWARDAGVLR